MLKLSVVVIICDKDYIFFNRVIDAVNEQIHMSKELVILDNRVEKKSEKLNTEGFDFPIKVVDCQRNAGQFITRKKAADYVSGEYCWFIDGDDLIQEVPDYELTGDIVYFDALFDNKYEGDLYPYIIKDYYPLWNLFVKTEIVKKVFPKIITDIPLCAGEDFVYYALLKKEAKTFQYIDDCFYNYRNNYTSYLKNHKTTKNAFKYVRQKNENVYKQLSEIDEKQLRSKEVYSLFTQVFFVKNPITFIKNMLFFIKNKVFENPLYNKLFFKSFKDFKKVSLNAWILQIISWFLPKNIKGLEEKRLISIVTPVYDGNYEIINKFIKTVRKNIKFNYEHIIVDNREKTKDQKIKLVKNCRIVDAGKNLGCFFGKKLGTENAKGEYVWLLDPDETVKKVDFIYTDDQDLIFCSSKHIETTLYYNNPEDVLLLMIINSMFFRREILLKTYNEISAKTKEQDIFFCEDLLTVYTFLQFTNKTLSYRNIIIGSDKKNDKTAKFSITGNNYELFFKGYKDVFKLVPQKYLVNYFSDFFTFRAYDKIEFARYVSKNKILDREFLMDVYYYIVLIESGTKFYNIFYKNKIITERDFRYIQEYRNRLRVRGLFKPLPKLSKIPEDVQDFTFYDYIYKKLYFFDDIKKRTFIKLKM